MDLRIAKTQASPEVTFDPDNRVLRITGESYPENSFDFYAPVLDWLAANLPALDSLRLEVSVSYMNSSSIKCMLDILDALGEAYAGGKDVSAVWNYEVDNPRALDLAEEFRSEISFPFTVTASGS